MVQGMVTTEERRRIRAEQKANMEAALLAWVKFQSTTNSANLYEAARAYFGIKPVIPD